MAVHHHKSPIVTDGLVFQVDADNDLSGNVSNVRNIVTPTETGSFVNGASVVNGAYDFDGVDDYIDFGNIYNFEYNVPFSCDFWIYIDSSRSGTQTPYLSKRQASPNFRGWDFQHTGGNELFCTITNTNLTNQISVYGGSATFDSWTNLSFTYDGSTNASGVNIYKDGVNIGGLTVFRDNLNSTIVSSTSLKLGDSGAVASRLNGQISNVKIYNKDLTAAEIQQNYNATKNKYH